jgi:hypothetical protein
MESPGFRRALVYQREIGAVRESSVTISGTSPPSRAFAGMCSTVARGGFD